MAWRRDVFNKNAGSNFIFEDEFSTDDTIKIPLSNLYFNKFDSHVVSVLEITNNKLNYDNMLVLDENLLQNILFDIWNNP